jgi:hypothetical protein
MKQHNASTTALLTLLCLSFVLHLLVEHSCWCCGPARHWVAMHNIFLSTQYSADAHTHIHTHPYEDTYKNHTSMSTYEELGRQIWRFLKSPLAPRRRRERHLRLKA